MDRLQNIQSNHVWVKFIFLPHFEGDLRMNYFKIDIRPNVNICICLSLNEKALHMTF